MKVLGNKRSKRFAMYIEDGVVKVLNVSEGNDDVQKSCYEGMVADIDKLKKA
jgi:peroxiredoxin